MSRLDNASARLDAIVMSREFYRRRASLQARSIADRLVRAADAAYERAMSVEARARTEQSGTERAQKGALHALRIAELAHLRECAQLAHEMQQAVGDAVGEVWIGPDAAGTGLGQKELDVLLEVLGAVQ